VYRRYYSILFVCLEFSFFELVFMSSFDDVISYYAVCMFVILAVVEEIIHV